MTIYTVLAPKRAAGDTLPPDPLRYVFVKEGIAWPAFFFAPLWLIFRRMWLVLAGYVVLMIAVSAAERALGSDLPGIFMFLVQVLLALEGNELRRWTLLRRGYAVVDVVEARNLEEAEIRFFAAQDAAAAPAPDGGSSGSATVRAAPLPPPAPPSPPAVRPAAATAETTEVVGLFPAPQPQGPRGPWS